MKPAGSLPAGLSRLQLEDLRQAGAEVRECHRVLQRGGLNLVGEVLRGQGPFVEFDHYPANDVFDAGTQSQYYYHAHRGLGGEHGHFHAFLRAPGMPAGLRPVAHPGAAHWPQGDQALAHLIAISMDAYGEPIGLFTVNRWVTGDAWYAAGDVIRMLDRFAIEHANPSWPTNRWIGAMLRLFRPQIEWLLHQRDAVLADWARRHPGADAFEDRALEVASQVAVDVDQQLASVEAALALAGPPGR